MKPDISEAEVALRLARPRSAAELVAEIERRLDRQERDLNHSTHERPLDQSQRAELLQAVNRADAVFKTLSRSAPAPQSNESAYRYRARVAADLKHHHDRWRNADMATLARSSPTAFANAEREIYQAAQSRGLDPEYRGHAPEGTFRERIEIGPDGQRSSYFHGDIADMLSSFTGGRSLAVTGWGPRFSFNKRR
jgi:hypothetical protein